MTVASGMSNYGSTKLLVLSRNKMDSFLPAVLYGLSQSHDFLDNLKPLHLGSAPHSSQKQHHCLSSTATTKKKDIYKYTFKRNESTVPVWQYDSW